MVAHGDKGVVMRSCGACCLPRSKNLYATLGIWLLLTIAALCSSPAAAQDGGESTKPLLYRRVFVRADDLSTWPLEGEKFLPIDSRDFHAWIAAANQAVRPNSDHNPAAATITEAVYMARLGDDGQLIDARGEWKISLRRPHPAVLPLAEMSLIIREPQWTGDAPAAARLGVWGERGRPAEEFGLEVPKSGTLAFAWRAVARPTSDGIEIPWRVPPATSSRLVLDLPEGMEPALNGATAISAIETTQKIGPAAGLRRWNLAIGPSPQRMLQIKNTRRKIEPIQPDVAINDELQYRASERGLELVATLRFESRVAPRDVSIPLPAGLELTSVKANRGELSWSIAESHGSEGRRAVIHIGGDPHEAEINLELNAWQNLVVDQPWRLPKLRPDDVIWASGTVCLTIDPALELRGLATSDCIQTAAAVSVATETEPEGHSFAAHSSTAELEVTLGRARPAVSARSGTMLTAGGLDITGKLITQVEVARGSLYTMEGEMQQGWMVESVETIPANALREWFIDRSDDGRRFVVQLVRAARPGRAVNVIVQGRLQRQHADEPLSAARLGMVTWRDVSNNKRLLSMQPGATLAIESSGTLPIIERGDLDDAERSLLGENVVGPIFDLARASPESSIRLTAERAIVHVEHPTRPEAPAAGAPIGNASNLIIVERLEIESTFGENGNAAHRAHFQIENRGAENLRFDLADGSRIESAEINGNPVILPADAATNSIAIQLPRDQRHINATVVIVGADQPLTLGGRFRPPIVVNHFSPLHGEWTIRLPGGFAIVEGSGWWSNFDWRRRLFGPLAARDRSGFVATTADVANSTISERNVSAGVSGWHTFRIPFVASGPSPVTATHRPTTTAWSLSLFLLSAFVGRQLRGRRMLFITLVTAAACLSLLLPDIFAPLATGIFLGLLFSLFIPSQRYVATDFSTNASRGMATAGTTAIAWLILLFSFAPAQGVDSDPNDRSVVRRVLIPVDRDGKTAGDKVYLGEGFLRELLHESVDRRSAGHDWLLLDASYDVRLNEQQQQPGLHAGPCSMTIHVEVFARDTIIELPLARFEAEWGKATLDGIPCELAWRENGRGANIAIHEPGRYQLTVDFIPKIEEVAGTRQIQQCIPPIAGAKLKLARPPALIGLAVAGMTSDSSAAGSAGALIGELDGSGQLSIRWPRQDMFTADARNVRVSEMRWLRLVDDSALLDVKYIIEGPHRPAMLTLAVDRGWQLLPDGGTSEGSIVGTDPEGRQSIRVKLPSDVDRRCEAMLRFRLHAAALPGSLHQPTIKPLSLPVAARWLAVSSGSSWECEVVAANTETKPIDEFEAVWSGPGGDSRMDSTDNMTLAPAARSSLLDRNSASLAVFTDKLDDTQWRVSVRPRHTDSTIDESLNVAATQDGLRVQYRADVTPGIAHQFRLPVHVPAGFTIDQVLLSRAGESIPIRWARRNDHEVQVFFALKQIEPYRLTLSGAVPSDATGSSVLPAVAIAGRPATPMRISLYRDERVLIDFTGLVESPPSGSPTAEAPPIDWQVLPVGMFQFPSGPAGIARVKVRPNNLETEGDTLTTLSQQGGRWWASWKCRLRVRQGTLDTLRLSAPAAWSGPFEVYPKDAAEVAAYGDRPAMLAIRLPKSLPTGSELMLAIRGPLASMAGAPVEVPNISSTGPSNWKNHISVPNADVSSAVNWSFDGVEPTQLPVQLIGDQSASAPDMSTAMPTQAYVATTFPHRVSMRPSTLVGPSTAVRFAETIVLEDLAGGAVTVTQFVVVPSRASEVTIKLPAGQRLVDIRLNGEPVLPRTSDPEGWNVQLGPPQLPQRLEIVSQSVARNTSSRHELNRPVLFDGDAPISVEMSLWSVGRPIDTLGPKIEGATPVTATDHAAVRLDRLIGIVEAATPAASALPKPQSGDWFRAWAAQFSALRQLAAAPGTPHTIEQGAGLVPASAEDPSADAWLRIDAWLLLSDSQNAQSLAETVSRLNTFRASSFRWTYCIADGATNAITVGPLQHGAASIPTRSFALLVVLGLAAVSVWAVRTPAAAELISRWPQPIGVLLGLAYASWLRPFWLGWLIVAVCVLLWVRAALQRRASSS